MKQIGVIGPESKNVKDKAVLDLAFKIGAQLAKQQAIVITGGCSGVAQAACKGAMSQGGISIGTPGAKRKTAVEGVTVEICTPIDVGDFCFAGILSSDALICFAGGPGTVAEIALAYRYGKPLIFMRGYGDDWLEQLIDVSDDYPLFIADTVEQAVQLALTQDN